MESTLFYSLRPLNWELSMCGCPIFSYKWKFVNFLLKLHGCILIVFLITLGCSQATDIGIKSTVPIIVRLMMLFWNLTSFGYGIVFILIVWKVKPEVDLLLKKLSEYLTLEDHDKILGFSTKLLLHKLLYCLIVRIPYVCLFYWNAYHDKQWIGVNVIHVMVAYYQVHDPFLGTLSLFLTLLKVLHLAEVNIVTGLEENMNHTPRSAHYQVKRCVYFKEIVSNRVSILVLFMFATLFINAVCNTCRFQFVFFDDQTSIPAKMWALLSLARLVIYCLEAMFLVFMTQQLSHDSHKKLSTLEDTIIQSQDARDWFFVLNEIKVAQSYKYRAFDFFNIDRSLLLFFVLSIVPLTVLFIQLINQSIR